jgi:hypothetical protein
MLIRKIISNVFFVKLLFQASILVDTPIQELGEAETEQITSVIFGLLRQNSFTFLEVLEGARYGINIKSFNF